MANQQEEYLIIKADDGDPLITLGGFLIFPVLLYFWITIFFFTIDKTSFDRRELSSNQWLLLFSLLSGYILHEYCQSKASQLFGGRPGENNRKREANRNYLERKYLFSIALRSWSKDTKFTFFQYFVILLSPVVIVFLCLPTIMLIWPNAILVSAIFIIGIFNCLLVPYDILLMAILIMSGKFTCYVVDKPDGTYLVQK